jgi:phosphatidylethanolamine/phosphatidyl-N-methylethanolamine N-methyltransferase
MMRNRILDCYRRYAGWYDAIFGRTLEPGRRLARELMGAEPGQAVLEIGVGTGLSLSSYPRGIRLTGVDISPEMLRRAEERARRLSLDGMKFRCMDASRLYFQDGLFDLTVAMYVVSVAPDPAAVVREMIRVTRPGGRIFIVNHFSRKKEWTGTVERCLSPLAPWMGFHPYFPLEDFLSLPGMENAIDHPVPPRGYWRILELRKPVCARVRPLKSRPVSRAFIPPMAREVVAPRGAR